MDSYDQTISFIDQIRSAAFGSAGQVFVDLHGCTNFSAELTPLLMAELQRIAFFRGSGSITGRSPNDQGSRRLLHATGFFEYFGWRDPISEAAGDSTNAFCKIRSGTTLDGSVTQDIAAEFADVLDLSDKHKESVQKALNEALENISEHAYFDKSNLAYPAESGRWWVSYVTLKSEKIAYLLACDLGVTIPATVPTTARKGGTSNIAALARLLKGAASHDEGLLAAAFEEGVTRRPDGRGGRGLTKMAELVRQFPGSGLTVWSGSAAAMLDAKNDKLLTLPLSRRFNGTYILWDLRQDQSE